MVDKELTESQQQYYEWILSALNKWIESDGVRESIIAMLDLLVEELLNENKALDIILRSKYDEMEYKWQGETRSQMRERMKKEKIEKRANLKIKEYSLKDRKSKRTGNNTNERQ